MQERQSSSIGSAFKNMLSADAIVVRDGVEAVIPATQLVVGDIVKLRPGSRVPADLRLILVAGLKVSAGFRAFPRGVALPMHIFCHLHVFSMGCGALAGVSRERGLSAVDPPRVVGWR